MKEFRDKNYDKGFRKNPKCIFHRIFKNIESFPNYLDYYPAGAIERQLRYISEFILNIVVIQKENIYT